MGSAARALEAAAADPRWGQIAALLGLVALGSAHLGFGVPLWQAPAALAGTLAGEAAARAISAERRARGPFDPLSPIITALSLTLLLRAGSAETVFLAGLLAVGAKGLLRWRGRHVFNPANFALVVVVAAAGAGLAPSAAWISPGQWGALGLAAVTIAGVGAVVAGRAARLDTTLCFLGTWAALVFGRALALGDPLAIPLHQLQSGALLVFAFFMISDPATTPLARPARLIHAALVAVLGHQLQTAWLSDVGAVHALFLCAPLVPLLDWAIRPAHRPGRVAAAQEAPVCSDPSPGRAAEIRFGSPPPPSSSPPSPPSRSA